MEPNISEILFDTSAQISLVTQNSDRLQIVGLSTQSTIHKGPSNTFIISFRVISDGCL